MELGTEDVFVLATPVVVVALAVLVARRRWTLVRAAGTLALFLYLLVVAHHTLLPLHDPDTAAWMREQHVGVASSNFVPFADFDATGLHFTGNVLLGLPFGLLVPLVVRTRRPVVASALACAGFGAAVEALQLVLGLSGFGVPRTIDVNDAMLNSAGALVGFTWFTTARLAYERVRLSVR